MRLTALVLVLVAAVPARAEHSGSLDTTTALVLVSGAGGLLAWDLYLMTHDSRTVSAVVRDASWKANAIPYALGGVAGHLFFSAHKPQDRLAWGLATLPAVVAFDVLARDQVGRWYRNPGLWFALGVGVGSLTWGRDF